MPLIVHAASTKKFFSCGGIHRSSFIVALLALFFFLSPVPCSLIPVLHANRLFTSGFETNNEATGGAHTEWDSSQAGFSHVTSPVYSGTYALRADRGTSGAEWVRRNLVAADSAGTYCTRFMLRRAGTPSADTTVHQVLSNGGVNAWHNTVTTGNVLNLVNDNDASSITGPTLTVDTWYRVENCVLLGDGTGTLELRVDGASQGTLSSKDTLPTDVRFFYFGIFNTVTTADFYFDDIAINDEGGAFQTSWPGEGKIALLKPTSNDTVTWIKTGANCSGTTNADCVDDVPGAPDDASGYNTSATANNEDRLNSAALPAEVPSDADMILLDVYDRWDGNGTTGTRTGRHLIWDEAGAQTNGPTHTRCDVTAGTWSLAATNQHSVFDLGTRTKANVEAFDLGYEPLNTAECRVTAIWGNVEWKPAPSASPRRRRPVVW